MLVAGPDFNKCSKGFDNVYIKSPQGKMIFGSRASGGNPGASGATPGRPALDLHSRLPQHAAVIGRIVMRVLLKSLFLMLLLGMLGLPLLIGAVLWLAIDQQPLIIREADIQPANIARAKRIIERNDPRRMRPGALRSIVVGQQDLDLALNYLAHRYAKGSAGIVLQEGGATLRASLALPANPLGNFVNLDAALVETAALPRIVQLRIGRLPIPDWIAGRLLWWALDQAENKTAMSAASDAIKRVSMRAGTLSIEYEWSDRLPDAIRSMLLSSDDQARLKAYQGRIAQLSAAGGAVALPMEELLGALLRFAGERGGDAMAENRAALITLAFFVNGKGVVALIPAARDWPRATPRHVTLAARHDFAQHYSISAAIAASSGSPLADAVGLYKEVDDAQGGSGFSFNDIAADRAGVRLGEAATASAASARKLQGAAAGRLGAAAILPELKDLPEFMQEAEFKRRYGGIGGAEYRKMMAEIERRVAALAVFR